MKWDNVSNGMVVSSEDVTGLILKITHAPEGFYSKSHIHYFDMFYCSSGSSWRCVNNKQNVREITGEEKKIVLETILRQLTLFQKQVEIDIVLLNKYIGGGK